MTAVKICGLTDEAAVAAAVEAGADFIGAVFFPPSPRHIGPEQAAHLFDGVPDDVKRVGLFVDPTDDDIEGALRHVRLDLIQLHGQETPERAEAIGLEFGVPLMKAVGVASAADAKSAEAYADIADWILLDAKPPAEATRPGGNAAAFDWSLVEAYTTGLPWMLAGGLTPDTVQAAITATHPPAVDVSSGVESSPGHKDPDLIRRFIDAAKAA